MKKWFYGDKIRTTKIRYILHYSDNYVYILVDLNYRKKLHKYWVPTYIEDNFMSCCKLFW